MRTPARWFASCCAVCAMIALSRIPAAPTEDPASPDLMTGIWAVLFGPHPECVPCDEVATWLGDGPDAFPEFGYALSIHRLNACAALVVPDGIRLHNDTSGQLRNKYSVAKTHYATGCPHDEQECELVGWHCMDWDPGSRRSAARGLACAAACAVVNR